MDKLIECPDEKPRWISTEERLPNEGEYVLIWVGNVQVAKIRKGISKKRKSLHEKWLDPRQNCRWMVAFRWISTV